MGKPLHDRLVLLLSLQVLHQVLVLLIIVHVQQSSQFLLDLSVPLYLVVNLLHLAVDLIHVVRFQSISLFTAVCCERFCEVLGMALIYRYIHHL
jgi:hypothetical protein